MKFTPMSDSAADTQANAFRLWPRGIYDFEVKEAKERVSKSGNDMIELNVTLYNNEGRTRFVFDYLVDTEATGYKLRHFAKATGMLAQYEKGELRADDMVGKSGKCQLSTQKGKDGYPDKNVIQDYVPLIAGVTQPLVSSMPDDEIPF